MLFTRRVLTLYSIKVNSLREILSLDQLFFLLILMPVRQVYFGLAQCIALHRLRTRKTESVKFYRVEQPRVM